MQKLVRWLMRYFRVVLTAEPWSTSTCLHCFAKWLDRQRLYAVGKEHDKVCPQCGKMVRDANAAGWIKTFGMYYAATGQVHPVSLHSEFETALLAEFGKSVPPAQTAAWAAGVEERRVRPAPAQAGYSS